MHLFHARWKIGLATAVIEFRFRLANVPVRADMVRDMSPPSSASEPRRGQGLSRSELTAARLLDAAQEAAADDGEGGLTFLRVAERAGT